MREIFEKFKKQQLVFSIITIALGTILIIAPALVVDVLVKVLGAFLIVAGIAVVILGIKLYEKNYINRILYGVCLFVFGVLIVVNVARWIALVNLIIRVVSGTILAIYGICGIIMSFTVKKDHPKESVFYVIIAAVAVGIGVSSLLNPYNASELFTRLVGAAMIATSVLGLISIWRINKFFSTTENTYKKLNSEYIEVDYEDKTEK